MAQKVGDLVAELKLKKDNFEKNLTTSQKRLQKFKQGATVAFKAIAVAVTAVSIAIMKAVGDTIKYMNEIRKASKATGVAVEKFQELAYAAKQEHGNTEALEKGLGNLTIRLGYAGDGLETYIRYFRTLGIEYKNSDGTLRKTEDVFRDIAQVTSTGALTTEKLAAVTQLFGARAGRELVPMLRKGTEWFDKMAQEANNLGIIMSEKDIEAVKEFDDKFLALKESTNALKREFALGLLPSLSELTEKFKGNLEQSKAFRTSLRDLGEAAGEATTGLIGYTQKFTNWWADLWKGLGEKRVRDQIAWLEVRIEQMYKKVAAGEMTAREAGKAVHYYKLQIEELRKALDDVAPVIDKVVAASPVGTPKGALLPPPFEPQPHIDEIKATLETIDVLADSMNVFAEATEVAAENAGELFGTMMKGGTNTIEIIKRLAGQWLRMTVFQNLPFLSGFMRVFGFQHGGVVSGMPMMNMRPDLAVANENPRQPELVAPLDAEKLAGLFQVNVHSADPGTTVDIVLKGLKGIKGQALADSLTRDIIAPALTRDGRR